MYIFVTLSIYLYIYVRNVTTIRIYDETDEMFTLFNKRAVWKALTANSSVQWDLPAKPVTTGWYIQGLILLLPKIFIWLNRSNSNCRLLFLVITVGNLKRDIQPETKKSLCCGVCRDDQHGKSLTTTGEIINALNKCVYPSHVRSSLIARIFSLAGRLH